MGHNTFYISETFCQDECQKCVQNPIPGAVCGNDGITYQDSCQLLCASCEKPELEEKCKGYCPCVEPPPPPPPPSSPCVTNASVYDKDWNITTPSTRIDDTYTCSFPFIYQGKAYNNKCVQENKYSYFCAINADEEGHGLDCPGCWQNETYKIGYCVHGDLCGFGEY